MDGIVIAIWVYACEVRSLQLFKLACGVSGGHGLFQHRPGKGNDCAPQFCAERLHHFAGRFVLSIKSECLSRLVLLGERHLRRAIDEYIDHYHAERCHQGIGNVPIDPAPEPSKGDRVLCRRRVGGHLSHYYREAA